MTLSRILTAMVAVGLVAMLAFAIVSAAEPRPGQGGASQVGSQQTTRPPDPNRTPLPTRTPDPTALLAIAIGQLRESDGEEAFVDLFAGIRNGQTGGSLHFYSHDDGYYNGGVQTLTITGGVIRATGNGPLLRPDGTHVPVSYTAEVVIATKQVTITVRGPGGYTYTLAGPLDHGYVYGGPGPQI